MSDSARADDFLRLIRHSQRGRLKIYLGYAAGVGKTCEMLLEAHRLKAEGVDVAVGLVETHGRAGTAKLLEGLEVIARRKQEYRGITLEEMDVAAVLKRRPEIVLVDELAHTNVPGSLNAKRYQDVQDILAQGIHVITTLNIQHLESLYDIVERASSVRVFERLPDSVLAEADQIVNVDVTSEDLSDRLREGKIYPAERIETALANFFKRSNLEQLRELALRELAAQIDLRNRDLADKGLAATPDQIMVCLSSRGPNSDQLLRYASRLAGRLNRNWYAVYVQTPSEAPTQIDSQTQRQLAETLTLAKQLGALVFTFKGSDIAETILQFAREYRVGHIVIGTPARLPWRRRLLGKRSLAEELIARAGGITLIIHDTQSADGANSDAEAALAAEAVVEPAAKRPATLKPYLGAERIAIWNAPVSVAEVLGELCRRAAPELDCLDSVLEREKQGSTFMNEGVAFPHARLKGLERPRLAIGLTHGGVTGVDTAQPVGCVFLLLTPFEQPDEQIKLLSAAGKIALDRQIMARLAAVEDALDACEILAAAQV